MSTLRAMQRALADALLAPKAAPDGLRGDALADRASRLAVYQHGYRVRLRDALATEFPGLALMAGRRFEPLLDAYVQAHPSGHYNIRWHGAGLAKFLETAAPWRSQPALAPMARLDWAISTAFDSADQMPVSPTALAGVPPHAWATLRLVPLANAQLVACTANADAFRRAADRAAPRPRLRHLSQVRQVLVWRAALDVRYRRLGADEALALQGVLQGEPFARVCERQAERGPAGAVLPRMAAWLQQWLADGLLGGLVVPSAP
jgi:hypothetical protein